MASAKDINDSLLRFTSDLYEKTVLQQSGNLQNAFLSPLSIYTACVMTMAGTTDTTLQEMFKALHVPDTLWKGDMHASIGSHLMKQLASSTDVEVSLANRLFLLNNVNIRPEFTQELSKNYNAAAENIGTLATLEAKRQRINQWVSQNTKTKIPELIAPGGLSQDVALAVINALFFRGLWEKPFLKEATSQASFHCLNGTTIDVPMMSSHQPYPLAELVDLDAKAVKLPFKGGRWKLLIVLPNQQDGLQKLLNELQKPGKLAALLAHEFVEEKAEVYLPRFKLSQCPPLNVKKMLQGCGIHSLFESSANLSKLCTDQRLFVNEITHKAVLEVDEAGATAAASTGIMVAPMCFMPTPVICVDHPFFLALLCDSDVPAFVGHVVKPEID